MDHGGWQGVLETWKGLHGRDVHDIGGLEQQLHGVLRGRVGWRGREAGAGGSVGEAGAAHNQVTELGHGYAPSWVDLEDALEDEVELIGDGQDRAEEVAVTPEGLERGVVHGGALPWVAAARQVHEDDSE